MEIDLTKMMILDMLVLDDEPLDLILAEAKVSDIKKDDLKEPYKNIVIPREEIRDGLKELIINKYVIVLDLIGEEIHNYNIDQVLKDKVLSDDVPVSSIWFRVTLLGRKAYSKNFSRFFVGKLNKKFIVWLIAC